MGNIRKFENFLKEEFDSITSKNYNMMKIEITHINKYGEEMILKSDGEESTFFHSDITDEPIPLNPTILNEFIFDNDEQKVIKSYLSLKNIT